MIWDIVSFVLIFVLLASNLGLAYRVAQLEALVARLKVSVQELLGYDDPGPRNAQRTQAMLYVSDDDEQAEREARFRAEGGW